MTQLNQDDQWSLWAKAAQGGDKEAYNKLLQDLIPYIGNSVRPKLANPDWADDLTQIILISIHKALPTYSPDLSFKPWLISIINFRTTDFLRAHYRKETKHSAYGEALFDSDKVTNPAHAGEYKDIEQALQHLNDKQRTIFLRTKVEGYSMKEVAKELGMSQNAVKVAAHRAQAKLKEYLEKKTKNG